MENIRHVGIYVDDLERMKKFYCNNFGFVERVHEVEKSIYIDTILGIQDASIELYKLEAPNGGMLELLKYLQDEQSADEGLQAVWKKGNSHIAITVCDVEKRYEQLCAQSVSFISKPCISPNGKAKVCFCQDPEGNYLELVEEL